jgi:penicillin-binding protein 2
MVVALLLATLALNACAGLGGRSAPTAPASQATPSTETTPTSPPAGAGPAPTAAVQSTPTIAPTYAPPTATPAANGLADAVSQYVAAWQDGRYSDMYQLLNAAARSTITETKFVQRYSNIATGIELESTTVQATVPANSAPAGTPPTVVVPMHVTYSLAVLGKIEEDNVLPMVVENGAWKVAWTPGLIFRDLDATRVVRYDAISPQRGSILDRNGNVLAQDGAILLVGVIPGEIKDEAALLKAMSDYLKMPPDAIKKLYASAQPDWFVPIQDLPMSEKPNADAKIGNLPGVDLREDHRRVYPYGNVAAHVVGYVTQVQDSELKGLQTKGYQVGDWIGRSGLEAWAENDLRGQIGATLAIVDQNGNVVRTIAQKLSVAGNNVVTTIDINYQTTALKTLGQKTGSLVVMNPQDNSILAIVSNPTFDPNQFVLGLSNAQWQMLNGPTKPLLFRAAQGLYATGSIFKVITMSAGLEKGGFKPTDTFDCGLDWRGLPGYVLHNWKAEGTLNLIQSLTGSCDPTFYTIGLKLNQIDPAILPTFARAFGLGQSSNTIGIDDAAGLVPDPAWKQKQLSQAWFDGDGVNLAIGQGYLLATPLQMANAFSTIANHGKLQTPVLVAEIKRPDGTVVKSFNAEAKGALPVSPTNLGYVTQGMRGVTSTPLGTAYYAWQGSPIPMEAKTGSAENETSKAHAWFVGYTSPDHPTLLALVMLEGGELGGQFAAPLGRQMVEYAVAHPIKPVAS